MDVHAHARLGLAKNRLRVYVRSTLYEVPTAVVSATALELEHGARNPPMTVRASLSVAIVLVQAAVVVRAAAAAPAMRITSHRVSEPLQGRRQSRPANALGESLSPCLRRQTRSAARARGRPGTA